MAQKPAKCAIPSLPEKPHQPLSFKFPKRSFGKAKPVQCSAQSRWFSTWPFLHCDESIDAMFCHPCVTAKKNLFLTSNNAADSFVSDIAIIFIISSYYCCHYYYIIVISIS